MPSKTACCGKDIFAVAQGMTIFEMVLVILWIFLVLVNTFNNDLPVLLNQSILMSALMIYLSLELYGLMKKKTGIIIAGWCIRWLCLLFTVACIPFFLDEIIVKEILKGSGMSITSEAIKMMR